MRDVNEGSDKDEWLILRGWGVLETNWPMYFGTVELLSTTQNKPKMAYSHELLKMAFMDYIGFSWTIMDYHELSWTILDYLRLS